MPVLKKLFLIVNFCSFFLTVKNEISPQMVTFVPAVGQTRVLRQPHAA